MRIDVWADLICPFCHLGRRRLELALDQFEHADEFELIWHSFELDRLAPAELDGELIDSVAAKYGVSREQMEVTHEHIAAEAAEIGLDFAWRELKGGNSFDAHRLIHFARERGLERPVLDRVMRAWFSEGAQLGDPATLVRLGVEGGLPKSDVRDLLAGGDHAIDVRTDEALAAQLGITSVPFFVFDQKYAVTGAQPAEVLLGALQHTYDDRGNAPTPVESSGGCGGSCGGCMCGGSEEPDLSTEATAPATTAHAAG